MAEGKIVTFYSFKGGVGRTMALANVAWILASDGFKVLVIDWDLDSPGLHKYFHPFLDPRRIVGTPGVVDLITDYMWAATSAEEDRPPDWHLPYAEILAHAVSVNWDHFPEGASLDFVSAGQQNRDYSAAVASVDWDNFYERMGGGRFFEALRDSMKRHYDFIFIDSRTGLSDIADICTVQLPDILVACFTLNDQSMEGAAEVARVVDQRYHAKNIRILPVPTRIEEAEKEKLDAGRSLARDRFDRFPRGMDEAKANAYWSAVEIPYKPFYAFEEMLASFGDAPGSPSSLLSAYERLASAIADKPVALRPMDEGMRVQYKDRFTRRRLPPPTDIYLSYVNEDRQWADWIAAVLSKARFRVRRPTDSVPAGSNERDEAAQAAAAANRTVAVLSPAYLRSPQSLGVREGLAADLAGINRRLIPVRVSETQVEPFADWTVLDLTHRDAAQSAGEILKALDRPILAGDRPADLLPRDPRYPRTIPPVWNAPTRNAGFTGRSETLERLRERLLGSSSVVVPPLALYGLGGVGKTQVALEYAHKYMAEYDVIWWVPSEQPALITSAFGDLAARLGLRVGVNLTDAAASAREALRRGEPYSRWLLIFDNADEPGDLKPHLPNGPGHVLVTSRNPAWSQMASPVEVDVFDRGESLDHLRHRVPSLSSEEADLVAKALGDLPIAVEQAGAWLAETGTSPTDYLEQLSTSSGEVLALNTPADYPTPVGATWRLSFDRLREQSPAAARLLQLCAFFAPEPISRSLVDSEEMIAALREFNPRLREKRMLAPLIRQIARYSLAKVDPANNTIEVHRLIQDVIRASMETAEEINRATHEVHKVLVGARPREGGSDNPRNWDQYDKIWPHLGPSRAAECDEDDTRELLIDRMRYLWRRRAFGEALSFGSGLARLWTKRLGADDMQTLYLRFHIANVLRSQGEYGKALAEDTAVHAAQQAALGEDHLHTLLTAGSLAADLRGLGQFQRAREMDQETYNSLKELNGEEDPATLAAANNLAIDLRLIGDWTGARDLDRSTMIGRRLVLGETHPYSLHSAAMLARDLREAGDYHGSVELLRKTLDQYTELVGADDLDTLSTAKSLAVSLRKAGQFDEAFDVTSTANQRYQQRYENYPDALACELNLACDLAASGDNLAASQIASEVHEEYERSLGSRHPFTLAVASNLAGYLRGTGAADEALRLAEPTLRSLRATVGGHHPYSLACALTMANCLHDQERFAEAEALELETIALLGETLGDAHPDTLIAQANLAVILRSAGRADEASELQRQVLEAMVKSPGPFGADHPSTAALRNWLLHDGDLESQPT